MTSKAHDVAITELLVKDLEPADLDAVVALDEPFANGSRRGFFVKRWQAMQDDPQAFIAVGVYRDTALRGFALGHLLHGEFGGVNPVVELDALGVAHAEQAHGLGHALIEHVIDTARTLGASELRTQMAWDQTGLATFFASCGFALSSRLVLEGDTGPLTAPAVEDAPSTGELDFSSDSADDFESLAHDRLPVRSLAVADFDAVARIDRHITGRDRRAYLQRLFDEALNLSGVRVSVVAESGGLVTGFIMARVDYGEFGRTAATAVIDTIGVDPGAEHGGVGHALMSQLLANLDALRVDRVRTEVAWRMFRLNGFLADCGFAPAQRVSLSLAVTPEPAA